jgi:hypothetical protein
MTQFLPADPIELEHTECDTPIMVVRVARRNFRLFVGKNSVGEAFALQPKVRTARRSHFGWLA